MREPHHCPECGCILKPEGKPRSHQQHRLFFGAVKAAFSNWPIAHAFLPSCEEHLRAYLLVKANHCHVIGQNLTDEADIFRVADFTERLMRAVRDHGSYGFVEVTGRKSIVVRYPKSIAFRECDQRAFAPIAQACFEIIQQEIGVPVEQLVAQHEAAA